MHAQIEPISRTLEFARVRFTYGITRVPEDRLNWSPGGSAPTPLKIAGKLAGMIGFIAGALQQRAMPERPSGGFPAPPETADAAIAAVNGAFEQLQAALAGLTEEDLTKTMRAPWGQELPISNWVVFVNQVVGYLQGQLNLVQLAYGDEDPNIPPAAQGQ